LTVDTHSMRSPQPRTSLERSAISLALLAFVVLALVSVIDGARRGDFTDSLPTLVLMAIFVASWRTGRPRITTLAWLCVVAAVVSGFTIDVEGIRVTSYVGFVALSSVLATFSPTHVRTTVLGVSALAGVVALWSEDSVQLSLTVVSACMVSGLLVASLRSGIEAALARSERVLEYAPVPIMEQNWTAVVAELDRLQRSGVDDLRAYLEENPSEISRVVGLVRLEFANRATLDFYGASQVAEVFARFNDQVATGRVVSELSRPAYLEHLVDLSEGRLTQDTEMNTRDLKGRPLWGRVRWDVDPERQGRRIVAVADITELKAIQSQLEEANRSKDRFIASVSHELRTPLAAVVGFTSELVDNADSFTPEERSDLLAVVRDESRQVANIIEDLLVAARADIGAVVVRHDRLDPAAEIAQLLRSFPAGFVLDAGSESAAVCGDTLRFRQILRNLVTNAHRYGGPDRWVKIGSDDAQVLIEVADNGVSLAPDDLARIFDPYTRAHTPTGTTDSVGLGLTVSRLLAEMMGGSLSCERRDGITVFALSLPRWGACPLAKPAVERSPVPTPGG
jgi:signal transduction histidine kinase